MSKKQDTKNLLCVSGWWYLRALVKGVTIKKALKTQNLGEAQRKRDKELLALKGCDTKEELLESVQTQLLGLQAFKDKQVVSMGVKLNDFWEIFLNDPERKFCGDKSMILHKYAWELYLEWNVKNYPHVQYAKQVTRPMCREYAAWLFSRCLKTATYNRYLSTFNYVWRIISEYHEDVNNPTIGLHVRSKKNDENIKQPFTDEEMRRIFAKENPVEFRLLCGFLYYAALRFTEATNIDWNQIQGGMFYGIHHKTGADATIAIPSQLQELLDEYGANIPHEGHLFPTYYHEKSNTANKSMKFMNMLRSLGIETNITVDNGKGGTKKLCIRGAHSFRHTAITNALRRGENAASVRRLAGHATEAMQQRYTHLGAEDAGKVAGNLGKFW